MTSGGRNLVILGILSCVIAVVTSGVSLAIYHKSGDIYLDRSRPGFLPDKDEIKEQDDDKKEEDYMFTSTGNITKEVLDEYIENLQKELDELDKYVNPFDSASLSDDRLGIEE